MNAAEHLTEAEIRAQVEAALDAPPVDYFAAVRQPATRTVGWASRTSSETTAMCFNEGHNRTDGYHASNGVAWMARIDPRSSGS